MIVVTVIVKLTQNMINYLLGQHELCRDLSKIEDSNKRKRFLVRKRMMDYRIRKRVKETESKLRRDLEILERWKDKRDLEALVNELKVVADSPSEELRKIFRQRGRGIAPKLKMRCENCGVETSHDVIEFKDFRIIGSRLDK